MLIYKLLTMSFFFLASSVKADTKPLSVQDSGRSKKRTSVEISSGAFEGLISAGMQHSTKSGFSTRLGVGYSPASLTGIDIGVGLVSFGWKGAPFRSSIMRPITINLGIKSLINAHKNFYIVWPDHYPRGYYPPNALFWGPYVDIGLLSFVGGGELYLKSFFPESMVRLSLENQESMGLHQAVKLGLGFSLPFE